MNVFKLIHPDVSGPQVNFFVESVYFCMVQCMYKQRFLSLIVLSLRDNFFLFLFDSLFIWCVITAGFFGNSRDQM